MILRKRQIHKERQLLFVSLPHMHTQSRVVTQDNQGEIPTSLKLFGFQKNIFLKYIDFSPPLQYSGQVFIF